MSARPLPLANDGDDTDPLDVTILISPRLARTAQVLTDPPQFVQLSDGTLYVGTARTQTQMLPPDRLHRVRTIAHVPVPPMLLVLTDDDIWLTHVHDGPPEAAR